MQLRDYFSEALSLFSDLPFCYNDDLILAGRAISLKTPSLALRDIFLPSLAHLLTPETANNPQLTIWYAEGKDLSKRLNAPDLEAFNAQGYNPESSDDDVQIFFQPWQQQVFIYSRSLRTGIYWVSSAAEVPWWEATFSFRAILHMWTHDLPAQLVHAGAISNGEIGVLITGKSGSGKSTSCLNLLRSGYFYLGDDYVWVELEPEPVVYSLYQTAKVEADNLVERFNDWIPFLKNRETYLDQKAIFDMKELFPNGWLPLVKLKAILLPNITFKQQTSFERTPSTRALLGMAPTTLHHLPHHRNIAYQKFVGLSTSLPAYNWNLGLQREDFQLTFKHFLNDELS